MNKNSGFSQVLVIVGSVLMLLGLLAVSTLVTKNQDNRNKASYGCSETTRPKTSCVIGGVTYGWTCNTGTGIWECKNIGGTPTATPTTAINCSSVMNGTECGYIPGCYWVNNRCGAYPTTVPGCASVTNPTECGYMPGCFWSENRCTGVRPTEVPGCWRVTGAVECATTPGCVWNSSTKKCSGSYPTTAPTKIPTPTVNQNSCSSVTSAAGCGYIPGCRWFNNECIGNYPTGTPVKTNVYINLDECRKSCVGENECIYLGSGKFACSKKALYL